WSVGRSSDVSLPSPRNSVMLGASVVLALAMILALTSHQRMVQATQYYSVMGDDVLDGLAWIEANTPRGSVIATTGPSQFGADALVGCVWGWWIEGLAQRKSFCSGDPVALAWQSQVQRTHDANRAFAGPISMENGWVRVGEYAPFGSRGNPIIATESGRGFQAMLFFNDAETEVRWSPLGVPAFRTDAPHYLPRHTVSQSSTPELGTIEHLAESAAMRVSRTVHLARDSSLVWVNYSIAVSGTINDVSIPVMGTSLSRLNHFDPILRTLEIGHDSTFPQGIGAQVKIITGGESLTSVAFETNPEAAMPQVRFLFVPDGALFETSFAVRLISSPDAQSSDVRLADALSAFEVGEVDYVFVDKLKVRETEWFANDPAHFRIAYQNFAVALYEVI
ncbi:MAG: hypothetical protein ACE5KQ_00005, partial [Thermoplasmata archaeon]